jgi:hypothetical protein
MVVGFTRAEEYPRTSGRPEFVNTDSYVGSAASTCAEEDAFVDGNVASGVILLELRSSGKEFRNAPFDKDEVCNPGKGRDVADVSLIPRRQRFRRSQQRTSESTRTACTPTARPTIAGIGNVDLCEGCTAIALLVIDADDEMDDTEAGAFVVVPATSLELQIDPGNAKICQ